MTTPSECGVAQGQRRGTKGLRERGGSEGKRDFFGDSRTDECCFHRKGALILLPAGSPASQGIGAVPVGMQLDGEGMRGEV